MRWLFAERGQLQNHVLKTKQVSPKKARKKEVTEGDEEEDIKREGWKHITEVSEQLGETCFTKQG